eukprot:CAMPEP_0198241542 /NCGR_PEP_ID=MMETSP1446-20131203/6337_1 /TAXON_ID=1461542 ORGANISM="Unidentified sp, Strain CCMP2111" /NCGR_SAMPLE_ID=MMETSP1446 /ASSEMBLY_ACC=CAM_ASM_001112 /LENGTH=529 /DNA_ID=CAMNT_0043924397 /DNA_START=48 /DNA_END=1637 /DNA_ORIENTATION=-
MGKGRDKKKKSRANAGVKKAHNQGRREELNEQKRGRREERKAKGGEDDIQSLLAQIALQEKGNKTCKVLDDVAPPSPRCNCTFTAVGSQAAAGSQGSSAKHDVILYGGEFYDGRKTYVYGDLYRYSAKKGTWSLVQGVKPPKPRSGHQSFVHRGYFYTFGGEYTSPNQKNFNHYRDLWRLDLSGTWEWEQLSLKGGPSARSGHRIVLAKGTAVLFGGFYDTGKDMKYYNDLWTLDIDNLKWASHGQPGQLAPSPRSACQMFADEAQGKVYVHGGYSKVAGDSKDGLDEKGVTHDDLWELDLQTMRWSRVKKSGIAPGKRAGSTIVTHKRNAVMFGGVVDHEAEDGEVLVSEFFNDMFNFHLDKHRWFPMAVRPPGSAAGVRAAQSRMVQRVAREDDAAAKIQAHFRGYSVRKAYKAYKIGGKVNELLYSPAVCRLAGGKVVYPVPRIKASMAVIDNVLWLYGGTVEDVDKETTLDDLWCINLNKLDGWTCIHKGTADVSQWEGSDDDDDDDMDGMDDMGSSGSDEEMEE